MGFLGFGKRSAQKEMNETVSICNHPVDQQKPLFEDPENPKRVTAIKCFQCGDKLPPAVSKSSTVA